VVVVERRGSLWKMGERLSFGFVLGFKERESETVKK
jgi:hypothetical protein